MQVRKLAGATESAIPAWGPLWDRRVPFRVLLSWASSSDHGNGARLSKLLRAASHVGTLQGHDPPGDVMEDGVHVRASQEGTSKPSTRSIKDSLSHNWMSVPHHKQTVGPTGPMSRFPCAGGTLKVQSSQ